MTRRKVADGDSGLRGLKREVSDLQIEDIIYSNDGNTIVIRLEDNIDIEISKSDKWIIEVVS